MELALKITIVLLVSYFVGTFNLSFFLGKIKGYDIRQHGSGNAGASNVVITMGKKAGLVVALFDIFKAWLTIKLSMLFCPTFAGIMFVSSVGIVVGNIFPFYLGFKGGKGFAALGGTVLAYDWKLFFILIVIALIILFIVDYICFIPMGVSLLVPFLCGYLSGNWWSLLFLVATAAIWYKHVENLKRIKEGKELRFSFLWNRKKEAERFGVENDNGQYPFGEINSEDTEAIKH